MLRIDAGLVERLHRQAGAEQWDVPIDAFADALERSAAKRFGGGTAAGRRARIVPGVTSPRRSRAQLRVRGGQRRGVGSLRSRVSPRRCTAPPTRSTRRVRRASWPIRCTRNCSDFATPPPRIGSAIVEAAGSEGAAVTVPLFSRTKQPGDVVAGCPGATSCGRDSVAGACRAASRGRQLAGHVGAPPATSRWSIDRGFSRRFNVPCLPRSRFSPRAIASDSAATMHSR